MVSELSFSGKIDTTGCLVRSTPFSQFMLVEQHKACTNVLADTNRGIHPNIAQKAAMLPQNFRVFIQVVIETQKI